MYTCHSHPIVLFHFHSISSPFDSHILHTALLDYILTIQCCCCGWFQCSITRFLLESESQESVIYNVCLLCLSIKLLCLLACHPHLHTLSLSLSFYSIPLSPSPSQCNSLHPLRLLLLPSLHEISPLPYTAICNVPSLIHLILSRGQHAMQMR